MQNYVDLSVSSPQRPFIQESAVKFVVRHLVKFNLDPHEFATAYTNRTVLLGYAPNLVESLREFKARKLVA